MIPVRVADHRLSRGLFQLADQNLENVDLAAVCGLLGLAIANDAESVGAVVAEIAAMEVDDGVAFRFDQETTRIIREQDVYAAVRVAMPASLAAADSR